MSRWQDGMTYGLAMQITKWRTAVLMVVSSMHNGLLARIDDVHIIDCLAAICFLCGISTCESLYVVERPVLWRMNM